VHNKTSGRQEDMKRCYPKVFDMTCFLMKHKGKQIAHKWNACGLVLIDFATVALHLQYVNINSRAKCKTGKNKLAKYIVPNVGAPLCMYVCMYSRAEYN